MKEYKYRGKRLDNSKWHYGLYYCYYSMQPGSEDFNKLVHIITNPQPVHSSSIPSWRVDPYTVGLWSGLRDTKGDNIYEGDIVGIPYVTPLGRIQPDNISTHQKVIFEKGSFWLESDVENTPIVKWCKKEKGKYVGNFGKPIKYKQETYLTISDNIYA